MSVYVRESAGSEYPDQSRKTNQQLWENWSSPGCHHREAAFNTNYLGFSDGRLVRQNRLPTSTSLNNLIVIRICRRRFVIQEIIRTELSGYR
jgi:hypothetical protein